MDQLKVVLRYLRKYHFWALFVLVVLCGLTAWVLATSDLDEQYTRRKSELDEEFDHLERVSSEPNFPNAKVIAAIKQSRGKLQEKVNKAWQILYDEQETKNPWPKLLGRDFLDFVTDKSHPYNAEIPQDLREIYQNFIKGYFPSLFGLVNVRTPIKPTAAEVAAAAAAATSGTQAAAPPLRYTGILDWSEASRKAIEAQYIWQSVPSSAALRLAQEDLWVYEALLRLIKDINAGATEHYNAYVKRIDVLEIGQPAAAAWMESEAFTTRFNDTEAAIATPPSGAAGGAAGNDPAAASDPLAKKLLDGRYVDDKGKPLPFGAPQPFPEFKMMPIRMKLLIEQSRIPHLIVNAANSNMPVEFRVLRLNPEPGKNFRTGGKNDVVAEPGMPAGPTGIPGIGGPGAIATPGAGATGADTSPSGREDAADPANVTLELLGIIYIFNPPDKAKLRIEGQEAVSLPGAIVPATSGKPAAVPALPRATPIVPGPAAPPLSTAPVAVPAASGSPAARPAMPSAPAAAPPQLR